MRPVKSRLTRVVSALLILLFWCVDMAAVYSADAPCHSSRDPLTVPSTDSARVPYGEGLLWKIEGRGIEPAYLFGTMHVEDSRVARLPPVVKAVFNSASVLVTEVELHPAAETRYSELMRWSRRGALQQYLDAPLFQLLLEILEEDYALPGSVVDQLKPWAVFTLLSRPPPVTGQVLDDLLNAQAVQQGKSVHGLETVDELVAVLDAMPIVEQVEILVDTICNRDRLGAQLEELTALYLRQDVAGMLAMNAASHQDEALFERFMQRILYQRSRRMARRIRDHLGEETLFIAVGALHLPGKRGILRDLEADGYLITRIF